MIVVLCLKALCNLIFKRDGNNCTQCILNDIGLEFGCMELKNFANRVVNKSGLCKSGTVFDQKEPLRGFSLAIQMVCT